MDTGSTPADFTFLINGEPGPGGWSTLIEDLDAHLLPSGSSGYNLGVEAYAATGREGQIKIEVWHSRSFLREAVQEGVFKTLQGLTNEPLYFDPSIPRVVSAFSQFDLPGEA